MIDIVVTARDGSRRALKGRNGFSLMEVVRDAGIDDLLALCGGCCSCATCHVFVDETSNAKLGAITEEESELLDTSSHRNHRSRLSCQIVLYETLNGLEVTIAPED